MVLVNYFCKETSMGQFPISLHRTSEAQQRELGIECRKLREDHLLTFAAIAQRKGVSVNAVRKWIIKAGK
jgi:DNA-binding transcriptional regulator YiaG